MSLKADPIASYSLPTWIVKSPTITTLSASTTSDRKSANSLIKSVWCPWWPVSEMGTRVSDSDSSRNFIDFRLDSDST